MSTTIGGIIDDGDEFHIYHGIPLGQIKIFGIKKKKKHFTNFAQTPPQRAALSLPTVCEDCLEWVVLGGENKRG